MKNFQKVVINGRFTSQKITGVQRYAIEIILALDSLIKNSKIVFEICIPVNSTEIMTNSLNKLNNIKIIKLGTNTGIRWELIDFSTYVKRNKGLSLNLCNTVPLLYPKGICCIHDITYKVNPQFVTTKHLTIVRFWHLLQYYISIKNSLSLFTVSNFSKTQIQEIYKPKAEIIVAYNGWQHFNTHIDTNEDLSKFGNLKDKQYFFSLATMAKNKNFAWVIEAARNNPDFKFVFAGNLDIKKMGNTLGSDFPENCINLGYVSDNDAKILYKHCKAFIFPSFYEGFGIPPLEALAMGAQVICSNASCLPEIFKNSVHYIDPYKAAPNFNTLLLEEVCDSKTILNQYNWIESAKKYLSTIESYF